MSVQLDDWLKSYYDDLDSDEQEHIHQEAQAAVDASGGIIDLDLSLSITLKTYLSSKGIARGVPSTIKTVPPAPTAREEQCASAWWHD